MFGEQGWAKKYEFKVIIWSPMAQISYQRNWFRSVSFNFKQDGLFATKKSMYHYNELALEPFNLCRCYSCQSKQPEQ